MIILHEATSHIIGGRSSRYLQPNKSTAKLDTPKTNCECAPETSHTGVVASHRGTEIRVVSHKEGVELLGQNTRTSISQRSVFSVECRLS